ncbi:hypothetical protein KC669_01080 [Candidatus Dojkabacteria bacterium]|uniref:Mur ligase central domain-containing protein n=1 Tax=Candidatus Dojkabacteria bacterium TaxID=2099670 RepID=A0A955RLD7_9BACT|nr:hypothetical protein [Candidatus Dojkabacteria bacterium]
MLSILKSYNKKSTMPVIGISGEHGKTTTSELLAHILKQNGIKVSVLNSIGKNIDERDDKITSDNASRKDVNKFIADSIKASCDIAIIELEPKKISNSIFSSVSFDSIGITSVGNLNEPQPYKLLLDLVREDGFLTAVSEDDEFISWLINESEKLSKTIYCYWVNPENLSEKTFDNTGISFDYYVEGKINSKLKGMHSFENIYLAVRLASNYIPIRNAIEKIKDFEPLRGRFHEAYKDKFSVIVDAAKHPFQLFKSMEFLGKVKDPSKKIISVASVSENLFDNAKNLGNLVTNYSDIVILGPSDSNTMPTFDLNSQMHIGAEDKQGRLIERFFSSEESQIADKYKLANRIFHSMQQGDVPVLAFDAHDYTGRLDAIKMAILLADPGDIVYIMGKGDERTITFDNTDFEWSDYEALKLALDNL